jgi:antitoxin component HigA of HigAB toxin-antitoxin module
MSIKLITNEQDYESALLEASYFFDHLPDKNTKEAEYFLALLDAIEKYESQHYSVT